MPDEDYYPLYSLFFVTGDYVRRELLFEDPEPDPPDPDHPVMSPRNFTGWSGRAQIRKNAKRDTEITATIEVSGFGTDGILVLELQESESEKCIVNGGWDLELTDPDGHPETVLGGPVVPKLDYTR